MQYLAGLFDAEGYVSLCPNGAFTIAVEMANEKIPSTFQDVFGGSIYTRKRDKRKKTYTWKINSISDQAKFFIDSILPFSVVKIEQLKRLKNYLDLSRNDRKLCRAVTCSSIKEFKQPKLQIHHILPRQQKSTEPFFYEWLAGFIDGDGNFVCNEYIDKRNGLKYFARQISVANTFLEPIAFINNRVEGCISNLYRTKNPLYKWTCARINEKNICESIRPFLKIKKEQCSLFQDFIDFPLKKRGVDISLNDRLKMYEIINQIKHLNSL